MPAPAGRRRSARPAAGRSARRRGNRPWRQAPAVPPPKAAWSWRSAPRPRAPQPRPPPRPPADRRSRATAGQVDGTTSGRTAKEPDYTAARAMSRGAPSVERETSEDAEVDVGIEARDELREPRSRARGHRPAQRAVAGVEVEVRIAGPADQRDVRRRGGAQARPVRGARRIDRRTEPLDRAARERLAAQRIELETVARQLRGSGDAQPLAQPCEHHPPRILPAPDPPP